MELFESIKKVCYNKVVWSLIYIMALIPIILSITRGGIKYCDSAYYLIHVEKINEGLVPYMDISLGYTPLWFYLMSAISTLLGVSAYNPEPFLVIHYVFVLGNVFCIYYITKYFSKDKFLSLFAGWLFLISSHWMAGGYILLEIPSMFWGLLASSLILYHRRKEVVFHLVCPDRVLRLTSFANI